LDAAALRAKIDVSRATFNGITSTLLNETIGKTDAAIAVAKGKGYEVDEILLVGGSTRMPQVTEILQQKYSMEPKILEPDEAVAKGAAIHAVNVYINNQQSISEWERKAEAGEAGEVEISKNLLENKDNYKDDLNTDQSKISIGPVMKEIEYATTKSYALELIVPNSETGGRGPKCVNLIFKNQPMLGGAISASIKPGTEIDNQDTVELVVYENESDKEQFDVDKNLVLGTALLDLPGNLPAGSLIEVAFTLNTEGILELNGRDLTSGNEVHATMQAKGVMAAEKVKELKEKSKGVVVT
jgi:molecular chaperone DnaK (HSP70)